MYSIYQHERQIEVPPQTTAIPTKEPHLLHKLKLSPKLKRKFSFTEASSHFNIYLYICAELRVNLS